MLEIRIGTRGSELALCQATLAREAILKNYPEANVTLKVIKTTGDVKLGPIPETVVGKSWFTKEIEDELLNETIDLAVHSLKDMALMPPPELYIGAMLPREDARDVLVTRNKEKLKELKSAASIGTDSARRGIQICALRPDLKVRSVRGNIGTRLLKLDSMEYDALVRGSGSRETWSHRSSGAIFFIRRDTAFSGAGYPGYRAQAVTKRTCRNYSKFEPPRNGTCGTY